MRHVKRKQLMWIFMICPEKVNQMVRVSIKGLNGHICAFCKNWNDPGNAYIRPVSGTKLFWEYERMGKAYCKECGFEREAWRSCKKFASKV